MISLGKIAFIILELAPESEEDTNAQIESQLRNFISNEVTPWLKDVLKVIVQDT